MRVKYTAVHHMAQVKCVKKALIRDNSVPVGQPAPVHVQCDCGTPVQVTTAVNMCPGCGVIYSGTGWIIEGVN